MNAILFRVRRELKNNFLDLLRHPGRLAGYVVIVLLLLFSLLQSLMGPELPEQTSALQDFRLLEGIYLGVLLLLGLPTLLSGIKQGTTFFSMGDVNHLFCSPVSPKIIMAYGIVRQAAASLLVMLFLLFYGVMAMEAFGVTWQGILLMLVGLAVALVIFQILALAAFTFCSGRPGRTKGVKVIVGTVLAMIVLSVLSAFLGSGGKSSSILAAISSPILEAVPIFGWIKGAVFGWMTGEPMAPYVYTGLTLICTGAALALFFGSRSDYYEDVLQATETAFERRQAVRAASEGGASQTVTVQRKIKVRTTGLKGGWGASAFFYRHLCEMRRRSPLLFLNGSTLALLGVSLFVCFISGRSAASEGEPLSPGMLMLIGLGVSSYILFFLNAAGDWSRELSKPWVFLAPAPPFQKLLWASATSLLKPLADGIVVFLILGLIVGAGPSTILICVLAYASMGAFYTAGNVLSMKFFGKLSNRGLLMTLCYMVLFLLFLPGALGSILILLLVEGAPAFLVGLPVVGWNLLITGLLFFLCRGILASAEAA